MVADGSRLPVARRVSLSARTREGKHSCLPRRRLWKQHVRKQLKPSYCAPGQALGPQRLTEFVEWRDYEGNSLILIVCQIRWKLTLSKLILYDAFKDWEYNKCYPLSGSSLIPPRTILWPWPRGGYFLEGYGGSFWWLSKHEFTHQNFPVILSIAFWALMGVFSVWHLRSASSLLMKCSLGWEAVCGMGQPMGLQTHQPCLALTLPLSCVCQLGKCLTCKTQL